MTWWPILATLLTLIRPNVPPPAHVVPAGYMLRACAPDDVERLGQLYFQSYDPGQACASLPEAVADIRAAFAGDYGELWPAASLVATNPERDIVAAIQVVKRAPWPDTPPCPFAIELFTAHRHRRRGLARSLVVGALTVIARANQPRLALRVSIDNRTALDLCRSLDFHHWRAIDPRDTPARPH